MPSSDQAVGKWNYANLNEPTAYGGDASYRVGAAFLAGCDVVEDWGCGGGWMKQFISGRYRGIDGSVTPFADAVVDLERYRSDVEGVFMRHVLEHNWGWRTILDNALASFQKRFALVLFTSLEGKDRQLAFNSNGVPDLALARPDLLSALQGYRFMLRTFTGSLTQYGQETIVLVTR